jgi:hypothetical protein
LNISPASSVAPKQRPEYGDYAREKWPQNSATWRNLACAPVWNWFQCMRFVQARRMATLHPQARIECIKTLLIDGRSRSEIGARLGLKRSVVCALVHRLKRDGVALPRSRPGPHHAAEAGAGHRIRTAHCHRRTIARTGRQRLPLAGRRRRSHHAVLRRWSQWASLVLPAACDAQCRGRDGATAHHENCTRPQGVERSHGLIDASWTKAK